MFERGKRARLPGQEGQEWRLSAVPYRGCSRPFADIGHWHSERPHWVNLSEEPVVTRFERGRPIRSWQPKRDGECNEALGTFVYAHAAHHGLIGMGLRLNEEVEGGG